MGTIIREELGKLFAVHLLDKAVQEPACELHNRPGWARESWSDG